MNAAAQIESSSHAMAFALAGRAKFTLVSKMTGTRFTFRVVSARDGRPAFVSVLNGPSNEADFVFLGSIFSDGSFRHGKKSAIGSDAPSAKAFAWAWRHLVNHELPPNCEVWHEGACGKCGRALTVPESIASGFGPECAQKMAGG